MYPAAARCRVADQAPHSKWHEESANALLDLAFLADDIHALVAKARARIPALKHDRDYAAPQVPVELAAARE